MDPPSPGVDSRHKIQRHPTIYFPDGDIVLCASNKASDILRMFRVDKVYLTRNSPVFRDMLSLASPPGHGHQTETYDGAAVVRLPDDAEDLASLLTLLYYTMYASWWPGARTTFSWDPSLIHPLF